MRVPASNTITPWTFRTERSAAMIDRTTETRPSPTRCAHSTRLGYRPLIVTASSSRERLARSAAVIGVVASSRAPEGAAVLKPAAVRRSSAWPVDEPCQLSADVVRPFQSVLGDLAATARVTVQCGVGQIAVRPATQDLEDCDHAHLGQRQGAAGFP